MKEEQYLIPANSKRSMLLLGLFTPIDLAIFGVGAGITMFLMMIINAETISDILFILTPVLVSSIMVLPVPNHRNVWQLTANVYRFFSNRRTYYWRGWCMIDGDEEKKGNQ